MKKSLLRPLMKLALWLSGIFGLVSLADKLAGVILSLHIYTGM